MTTHQHLTRHALALRLHLQHGNDRMREALSVIADIAQSSAAPKSLPTTARIARSALIGVHPVNHSTMEVNHESPLRMV